MKPDLVGGSREEYEEQSPSACANDVDLKMENHSQMTSVAVSDSRSRPTCLVCKKPAADDQWFCRLTKKVNEADDPQAAKILLCSPVCALRHFAANTEQAMSNESKAR